MLWTVVILMALAGMSLLAYAVRALDAAGAVASFALGLVVALAGGFNWLFLMVAFTGIGVLATRFGYASKVRHHVAEEGGGERGFRNVVANGGAPALAAVALWIEAIPDTAAALAFAAAVAAVTADTLASEIGALQGRARIILPPFPLVRPGVNGAVSWAGQSAALAGALMIAGIATWLLALPPAWAWVPALAGFLGCQLDSVLGATLEGDATREGPLSKQDVNFIASAVPALVVLVLATL